MNQQQGGTFYISFDDNIYPAQTNMVMSACAEIVSQYHPDELYFLFASPGGSVAAGISLYNFLKAIPPKITMHNIGRVDSIGNVIFSAGDKRLASPYTSFLFHGLIMPVQQSTNLTTTVLKEWVSSLEADARKISGIIRGSSSFTEQELLAFFAQGETKDAEFAKEKGFVQEILSPAIPPNAPFLHLRFTG